MKTLVATLMICCACKSATPDAGQPMVKLSADLHDFQMLAARADDGGSPASMCEVCQNVCGDAGVKRCGVSYTNELSCECK